MKMRLNILEWISMRLFSNPVLVNHSDAVGSLVQLLEQNTIFTELNLSWNQITDVGVQSLAQSLAQMLEKNTTLTTLYLYSNQIKI
jgi:hypothetical protein